MLYISNSPKQRSDESDRSHRGDQTGSCFTVYLSSRPSPESILSHDADGNITQDGTWAYTYDGENRLHSMTKPGTTISFLYDWMGRRGSKTVDRTTTACL